MKDKQYKRHTSHRSRGSLQDARYGSLWWRSKRGD